MKLIEKAIQHKKIKWLFAGAAIFLALLIIFAGTAGAYALIFRDKVYPGAVAGGIKFGGKTLKQTEALIQAKVDKLAQEGVRVVYKDNIFTVLPIVSTGSQIGAAHELWVYDVRGAAKEIYNTGRKDSRLYNIFSQYKLLFDKQEMEIFFELDEDGLKKALKEYFKEWETEGKNADFVLNKGNLEISEEARGRVFDYEKIINQIKWRLAGLDNDEIHIELNDFTPQVAREEARLMVDRAKDVLKIVFLQLEFIKPDEYQDRKIFKRTKWTINREMLVDWLKLDKNKAGAIIMRMDKNAVSKFLKEVSFEIDTPAKDAKFVIKDGRVVEWQSSLDGFTLDYDETYNQINKAVMELGENRAQIVLSANKSKITNESVNDLGIRELIGLGESNFSGSPVNRRHNIQVGADSLNGILIKPGEEFSLLAALGEINAASGYKPELVIKEGETTPEYGGGLCQIGTTLFRSVVNSGFKISERRNHSYRVIYYEPAGTDATIYDPWPDFKFINDMDNYVLLQTKIEGDKLIFEFWGTSDGREVATTTPIIYNIIKPGEPKYITTSELAAGEKRRMEIAHSGADAYFKRTIIWPSEANREQVEEVWNSHYVPWREVWLVGATSTGDGI